MTTLPLSQEQRQFLRSPFDGEALLRTERHPMFIPCEPRNVSVGGICVRTSEEMEIRSEVDVQLKAVGLLRPLQCRGRVNWTTARLDLRAQPPIPYDVGIEFIGLSPQLRVELQRIVESWRNASSGVPR